MKPALADPLALLGVATAMRATAVRCRSWAKSHPDKASAYRQLAQELEESAAEIEAHCGRTERS
jgi:hypothetical protein